MDWATWGDSEWLAFWQLVAAVLGLGFAGWQLLRTANATARAARLLGERLIANDLLVLLPDLERLEDEVDASVKTAKADRVGRALVEYMRKVQRVHGHMKASSSFKEMQLVQLIETSVTECQSAKVALYESSSVDIVATVRAARAAIGAVILEAASFSASLQKGSGE